MNGSARTWLAFRLAIWVWVAVLGASIALSPLLSSQYYLAPGSFIAAVLVLCGALLRTAGAPWPVVGLVQLAVLTEIALLGYVGDGATLGVLPDRDTADAVSALVRATLDHAREYPAPVPALDALDATLALGMGLLAIVVDLLASSRRTVPLVGLVFLSVYMIPVSLLSGHVSMWAFIPGALGYVFLLAAAERLYAVGWGHHLADQERQATGLDAATRGRGITITGRRAGFGAVACAVILPLFVPTLSPELFGQGGGTGLGGGGGTSDVTVDNPILDLRRNLTGQSNAKLARVTDATDPPSYLRLTALNELTARGWSPGERGRDTEPVDASLPDAPGTASGVVQSTIGGRVTVSEAFHSHWLPVVYAPRSIAIDGPWRVDENSLDIMSGEKDLDAAGVTYSFSSAVAEPTPAQLRNAPAAGDDLRALTLLPPSLPDSIRTEAENVTRGARNDFDRATALQRWFRSGGGFVYDLSPRADGSGLDTIANFLEDDRRGYCEQFAGAMAIMARTLGIPARVAVGFLRPERDGKDFVFRGTDMHAWPELYFDGVGWVSFEPTPGGAGYDAATFSAPDGPDGDSTAAPKTDLEGSKQPSKPKQTPLAAVGGGGDDGTSWGRFAGVGATILVLLALLTVPLMVRTVVSRRRWRRARDGPARAEAAWAELRNRVRDLGGRWDGEATPRGNGRIVRDQLAGDADAVAALDLLVTQTERARYDRDCAAAGVREAVNRVVECLAARASLRRRLLARWLPMAWAHAVVEAGRRGPEEGSELIALRE